MDVAGLGDLNGDGFGDLAVSLGCKTHPGQVQVFLGCSRPGDLVDSFLDEDGDGYGTPDTVTVSCALTPGRAPNAGDCNDRDAAIGPGIIEQCDGVDNDCDGNVDEAGARGEAAWYEDRDGDGLGANGVMRLACAAPEGFVAQAGDCDDRLPDGTTDEDPACTSGPGAQAGCGVVSVRGLAALAFSMLMLAGRRRRCGMVGILAAGPASAGVDTPQLLFQRELLGQEATAMAAPGDVDGDGHADLLLSRHGEEGTPGQAWLVYGSITGLSTVRQTALVSAEDRRYFGYQVTGLGDLAGDGLPDLAVAAPLGWGAESGGGGVVQIHPRRCRRRHSRTGRVRHRALRWPRRGGGRGL